MRTRACDWGDPRTLERRYGVRVYVPGHGWLDVAIRGTPALFKTTAERDELRRKLRRNPLPEPPRLLWPKAGAAMANVSK